MINDVTQLPSLDYLRRLPDWISLRYGACEGVPPFLIFVVTLPDGDVLHCDCTASLADLADPKRVVEPVLHNLLGAINYKKHGQKMTTMYQAIAKATATGEAMPEEFRNAYEDNFNAYNLVAEICGTDKLRVSPQDLWSGALGAP